ncbi:MAG TPA: hypothetical protein VGH95_01085 [Candidatus Aquirickettsiella sp.]|jgi:hypothetical protein
MIPLQRIVHREGDRDQNYQSLEELDNLLSESSRESSVNLDSLQETHSAIQNYLLRHWHYSNFAARFALLGIKHKDEPSSLEIKPPVRLFWLSGESVPLETSSKIRLAHWVKDFFNYASFFVCGLEPAILAGLLLHDLRSYGFYPDERCGTSFSAILDGTANNQITWTNHFGSDVLHEAAYWMWTGALLLPPIASYIKTFFNDKRRLRWLDISHEVNLNNFFIFYKAPSFYNDTLIALYPWSSLREALAHAKFLILWEGRNREDQTPMVSFSLKKILVNKLVNLASPSRGFPLRFQALRILAQIAESFHTDNLERFIDDPSQKNNLLQLRETILMALKSAPVTEPALTFFPIDDSLIIEEEASTPLIERTQTPNKLNRYFSWTLGETEHPLTPLFFIPSLLSSLYTMYAVGRYLQLIISKVKDLANHYQAQTNCEAEGNSFTFLQQNDRYECVACDWSFVNYQNMFTTQACLDKLLQQSMTPVALLHHLNQLPSTGGITQIDLSQQDWPTWSVTDWKQLLNKLQSMLTSRLELLNVSDPVGNDANAAPTHQHIQALSRFLISVNVTRFDISNQWLNDESFNLLLNSLVGINLSELNLANTNMTDVSATSLANLISGGMQNLNNLQLAGNQITDLGLQKLADGIQQSFLHTLDLSGQKFSANALQVFSDTLKGNFYLKILKISNAELKSEHVTALQACLKNLESLDVSNNKLSTKGVQFLITQARSSRLSTLNIAENQLTDQDAVKIAEHLPATSLQHLDISGIELGQPGFSALVNVFSDTRLLSFTCEGAELNDHAMAELTAVFSNHNLLLRSLNLNNNKITDASLMDWLDVLPNTNLRELHLNHNQISNQPRLAEALSKTKLTLLDLSSNLLDGNFFNALAPVLQQSHLQQLILNDNIVEAASLNNFAKELVKVSCHANDLNTTQLSRQEKRVFYPMEANTKLTQLNVIHDNLDVPTIRSFCRVASSLPDIQFIKPERLQQLDWKTCDRLPTNVSQSNPSPSLKGTLLLGSPFLMSLLCAGGILCLIALLYGGYRASQSTYRFFRPAPPRLPLIEAESAEINNDNGRPSSRP